MLGGRSQSQTSPSILGRSSNNRSAHNKKDGTCIDSNNEEHWRIISTELNTVLDFAEDSQKLVRKEDAEK